MYLRGVHKYLAHQHRQGQTLGAALFHKVLFNRNLLRLFELVDGTRRVPTTFKRIFKSELFMHTPLLNMDAYIVESFEYQHRPKHDNNSSTDNRQALQPDTSTCKTFNNRFCQDH